MAPVLFSLNSISVSKSFFGLKTSVVYNPTNSPVKGYTEQYSSEDGELIRKVLTCQPDQLAKQIEAAQGVKGASLGTMLLNACVSDDHQFVAMQLFRYSDNRYNAVTDVEVFEGEKAKLVAKLV